MTAPADLAALASVLADETRAAMCLALLDGRAWTAGELAAHARVAPSTATGHLHRLVAAGFLTEHRQGRHRYVQLTDATVAHLIEDLASRLPPRTDRPRGLRAASVSQAMRRGRTCYDHLAGLLGVAVTDAMAAAGYLDRAAGLALTPSGTAWMTGELGAALPPSARPLSRGCIDWTERRLHLAGQAGAALCATLLSHGWLRRVGTTRAVRLTPAGTSALHDLLGVDLPA